MIICRFKAQFCYSSLLTVIDNKIHHARSQECLGWQLLRPILLRWILSFIFQFGKCTAVLICKPRSWTNINFKLYINVVCFNKHSPKLKEYFVSTHEHQQMAKYLSLYASLKENTLLLRFTVLKMFRSIPTLHF